ncbi:DUF2806 domain-containing protein [Sinorhizobium meliloti]|uniref:DUF2806 domain-containing protein n=1 Tax=Rhizobium meliloti TaxID=382 RepID=UPI0013E8B757|nr:DUF2806 domain-containing protein [Sinorhizobium meliloti]MDE3756778.1 DUF2806 domain-containing protein [Sinorhizobium meliloti]
MEIKDLVGLEKPATELINRVSEAVGGIAKPWQIKRVARAEAEAKKILAVADLEITEIRERAVKRMILEEEKNQQNIEAVTAKAIPHLSTDAKPEELDEDFVRYLFDKAKMVSNEEMQSVWAKILAEEASKAGSFSRRTMDIVSQMRKEDAELFTRFCKSVWMIGALTPVVPKIEAKRSDDDFSLSFEEFQHLEDIGLITFADSASSFQKVGLRKTSLVNYYGCPVYLHCLEEQDNSIDIGRALLTASGKELIRIAGSESSVPAFEQAVQFIVDQEVGISIPIDAKDKYLSLH